MHLSFTFQVDLVGDYYNREVILILDLINETTIRNEIKSSLLVIIVLTRRICWWNTLISSNDGLDVMLYTKRKPSPVRTAKQKIAPFSTEILH